MSGQRLSCSFHSKRCGKVRGPGNSILETSPLRLHTSAPRPFWFGDNLFFSRSEANGSHIWELHLTTIRREVPALNKLYQQYRTRVAFYV